MNPTYHMLLESILNRVWYMDHRPQNPIPYEHATINPCSIRCVPVWPKPYTLV